MIKKSIGIFLVLTMLTTLAITAGGCGKSDKSNELNALNSVGIKNLKEETLTFYFPGAENGSSKAVLSKLEKQAYNELKVKLNFKWINSSEYMQLIYSDLCSNSREFDGFFLPDSNFYMSDNSLNTDCKFIEYAKAGYLKDISSMLHKYASGIYGMLTREQLNAASYDGKLYAVPNLAPDAKVLYAVVREDYRKKYKLHEIETYDDYDKYLKAIKTNENAIKPGLIYTSENSINLFANAYGYSILDQDLQLVYKRGESGIKIQAWEQTPEFKTAANKLTEWEKKDLIKFSDEGSDSVASILCLNDATIDHENSSGIAKFYRMYPQIAVDRESPINSCMVFNANSNHVDRALQFFNWIETTQKIYDLFMYGIKGRDYTLDDQNRVLPKDTGYIQWPGRNAFMNLKYERPQKGFSFGAELIKFFKKCTIYPQHTGFYPDYSELSSDASSRKNVLQLIDQNLQNGLAPLEGIDSDFYNSYKNGTANIVKAVQKQIDKWRSDTK